MTIIQTATVPGTKVTISIDRLQITPDAPVAFIVYEYVDATQSAWSRMFRGENAEKNARDAANQRWTNAIAIRNAKKVQAEVARPEITEGFWEIRCSGNHQLAGGEP